VKLFQGGVASHVQHVQAFAQTFSKGEKGGGTWQFQAIQAFAQSFSQCRAAGWGHVQHVQTFAQSFLMWQNKARWNFPDEVAGQVQHVQAFARTFQDA
jgi:hypothetical protein